MSWLVLARVLVVWQLGQCVLRRVPAGDGKAVEVRIVESVYVKVY